MIASGSSVKGATVNVLGLTFKENCGDLRNSRVIDIIHELQSYGVQVRVSDPMAEPEHAHAEYGVHLVPWAELPKAQAMVVAVAHDAYARITVEELAARLVPGGVVVDVKSVLDRRQLDQAGYRVWRL